MSENHAETMLSLVNSINIATYGLDRLLSEILETGGYPALRDIGLLQAIHTGFTTPTDIARAMGLPGPSVSQAIARLTEAGFLESAPDNIDKRKRRMNLTPTGKTTLTNALTHIDTTFEIARYPQNTDTLTKLQRSLDKYAKSMRLDR